MGFGINDEQEKRTQDAPLNRAQASGGVTQVAPEAPGIVDKLKDKAVNKGIETAVDPFASEFAGGIAQGFGNAQAASALGVDAASGIGLQAFGGAGAAVPAASGALTGGSALGGLAGGAGAGAGLTALGTAVPYVGAGILAGKALGLFNEGGEVPASMKAGDIMGKAIQYLNQGGMAQEEAYGHVMGAMRHYNNGGDVLPDMDIDPQALMQAYGGMQQAPMANPNAPQQIMEDPNLGYKPSGGPLTAKEQMDVDKMDIQRQKAQAEEDRKEAAFNEAERRKEEAHKLAMQQKKEVHSERKGPLATGE